MAEYVQFQISNDSETAWQRVRFPVPFPNVLWVNVTVVSVWTTNYTVAIRELMFVTYSDSIEREGKWGILSIPCYVY